MLALFPTEIVNDIWVQWSLITVLFLIVFMFQFYVLNEKVKSEREYNKKLEKVVKEQEESAKLLIRRDTELTQANIRLKELDKTKSEFVSVAAHQLRTPLVGVKWGLDSVLDNESDHLTDKQKKILENIKKSNDIMIRLVADLLKSESMEIGAQKMRRDQVDVKNLVEDAVSYLVGRAKEKNINISVENISLPDIFIDPERIREVFQNLLENSINYTPEGGEVLVGFERNEDSVTIKITDTGIGIPEDRHNEVFSKFFRSDGAIKMETQGTGLGLFVSKGIVEKHNGKIWFESTKGLGTKFYVQLPIEVAK